MGGFHKPYGGLRGLITVLAVAYLGLTMQALTCVMNSAIPVGSNHCPTRMSAANTPDAGHHNGHATAHLSLCSCLDKLVSATPALTAGGIGHLPVMVAVLSRPDGIHPTVQISPSGGCRAPPVISL